MATADTPAAALRARAAKAFSGSLGISDSVDLEHACWAAAECSGAAYKRSANRALYALRNSEVFAELVRSKGALTAMATPHERLYPSSAADADNARLQNLTETGKAFLADISRNDLRLGAGGVVCAKCKSTEIITWERQVQSADEGMTVFARCQNCDKRWRL